MSLPKLTLDDIRPHCCQRSFERGYEYYTQGAIGNPTRHDYTLWADCQGTEEKPYRVRIQLMPTGIAEADCSCPYHGVGYCKHIIALLLTYIRSPQAITAAESVLAHLETQPKSHAIGVLSELLRRVPEMLPVAQYYAYISPTAAEGKGAMPQHSDLAIYAQRVDECFGDSFLEHQQVRAVQKKLYRLKTHADALAQCGETSAAQTVLTALIQKCIERYEDTPKGAEIPRFVRECTLALASIISKIQEQTTTQQQHIVTLLSLSFDADGVFTDTLTHLIQQVSTTADVPRLEQFIQQRLSESPNRGAHVRLLLAFYERTSRRADYLRLARSEGEFFRLVSKLLEHGQFSDAWQALREFSLNADEYWYLIKTSGKPRCSDFERLLLAIVESLEPDTAMELYQRLVNEALVGRKRRHYYRARDYLLALKRLYIRPSGGRLRGRHFEEKDLKTPSNSLLPKGKPCVVCYSPLLTKEGLGEVGENCPPLKGGRTDLTHLTQIGGEIQWQLYLAQFRRQHARKRVLLEIIEDVN